MVTTDDMIEAYELCLRRKRGKKCAMDFDLDWCCGLQRLTDEVNARTYVPGRSICFVVTRPRLREVFAADFADRILHHYIAMRLEPLLEETLSPRTFNCRRGKGQLYGIRQLYADMYDCSDAFRSECWLMKLDLKGFFMSIDKALLARMVDDYILRRYQGEDREELRFVCRVCILHEPQLNCERRSRQELFDLLPDHKTLFRNEKGHGVAIGNLYAQLFANLFLSDVDWMIERELGVRCHGRYVDDIYLLHPSREHLLGCVPRLRAALSRLGITINEHKFYLQPVAHGIRFTGAIVKPWRIYTDERTIDKLFLSTRRLARLRDPELSKRQAETVNSYLGAMRHTSSYALRCRALLVLRGRPDVEVRRGARSIAVTGRDTRRGPVSGCDEGRRGGGAADRCRQAPPPCSSAHRGAP